VATVPVATPSQTTYFGHVLNVVPPLLCPTALAIINNRREIRDIPLWDGFPATRAEANAREDYTGSTKAEWEEINLFRRLALGTEVPRAGEGRENLSGLPPDQAPLGSKRWEHTFNRMRGIAEIIRAPPGFGVVHTWFNSMYTPGMFSGEWLGRVCVCPLLFSCGCILFLCVGRFLNGTLLHGCLRFIRDPCMISMMILMNGLSKSLFSFQDIIFILGL